MSDIVTDAVEVLVPLLSMGAGAAARDIAERGGTELADGLSGMLSRVRTRLKGQVATKADIEGTLRSEIADGQLTIDELKLLVSLGPTVSRTYIQGNVKNVISDSTLNIETFNA
jgi:hypothetical protein